MLKILKNALFITLPYSIISAVLLFTVSVRWAAAINGDTETYYYGLDAIKFMIRSYGIINYLLDLLPQFLFFFITIFIALVTQGLIFYKKPRAFRTPS